MEAGHEVGFHCREHVRHSELGPSGVAADTAAGLEMLASIGIRPRFWRTPWGEVTAASRWVAAEHGLAICGWNLDSHDWRGDGWMAMLAALTAERDLADGDVVLMHDGIGPGARRRDCAETVRLTAALVEAAAAAGLRTVSVAAIAAGATV